MVALAFPAAVYVSVRCDMSSYDQCHHACRRIIRPPNSSAALKVHWLNLFAKFSITECRAGGGSDDRMVIWPVTKSCTRNAQMFFERPMGDLA